MSWGTKKTKEREKELLAIAAEQGGYFTSKQAIKCGYRYSTQKYHVEVGNWTKENHGMYRFSFLPFSKYDELIKVSLWSRDKNDIAQAVISHESALFVHELGDIIPGKIYITVPKGFRKKPKEKNYVLVKENLQPDEIQTKEGFNVTTPIKTIVDVAKRIDPEQFERVVADSIKKDFINQYIVEQANTEDELKRKLLSLISRHKR